MQVKELVVKAANEGNLYKILLGQDEYKCEINRFIAADVPTDWSNIIRAIYVLYKEMPNLNIKEKYEEAINYICNQGFYEVYCAVMVVFFQIMSEERKQAPFMLNRGVILRKLRTELQNCEEELKKCKEYTGKKYTDGMWGDIRRVNNILNEDYGITII